MLATQLTGDTNAIDTIHSSVWSATPVLEQCVDVHDKRHHDRKEQNVIQMHPKLRW